MSSTVWVPPVSKNHVAKHRSTPASGLRRRPTDPTADRPGRRLRGVALLSGAAVAATGLAVSAGVLAGSSPVDSSASAAEASSAVPSAPVSGAQRLDQARDAERAQRVSRSEDRTPAPRPASRPRVKVSSIKAVPKPAPPLSQQDPRTIAKILLPQFGMDASQFSCLDALWVGESGWDVHADNPSSDAYGIPQALPGSKMASAGPDWANNPVTQIKWGLGYVKARYGSACAAESFKQGNGWY